MERIIETVNFPIPKQPKATRVAAYARVSSGKDAMLHSLSAQVSYYSDMIQRHPGWIFCGVYVDEALTGTKEVRENFQKLLADCRAGKVDMVITKSVSRFARNTVTLLQTVRELKTLGIDVFFEEQNIHTNSSEGELMLTILASFAQEESLSASENQKWRIQKSYEQGKVIQWRHLFGYEITNDVVAINPEQAEIVREIFTRAISGESFSGISRDLNSRGITTVFGNPWTETRVHDVLSCEKYIGDSILQKKYVNNHMEKKVLRNKGEMPMYYVSGTHEPIVDRSIFEKAQEVLRYWNEKTRGHRPYQKYPFTGKILCGNCGLSYKHITVHGKHYWGCRTYQEKGKAFCESKRIPEKILEAVTAEVLELDSFDGTLFLEHIDRIEVPGPNELVFRFKDGAVIEKVWKDPSRRDSWTPQMKEAARQRALQRRSSNGNSR